MAHKSAPVDTTPVHVFPIADWKPTRIDGSNWLQGPFPQKHDPYIEICGNRYAAISWTFHGKRSEFVHVRYRPEPI